MDTPVVICHRLVAMGRFGRASLATGVFLPESRSRLRGGDVAALIGLCANGDARVRQLAAKNLCTCHVGSDDDAIWSELFRLINDPDDRVRSDALHALTDSTPTARVAAVVDVLIARYGDPDPHLRRRIRKTLARYRRTGMLTDAAR
jgi:HEAT repeats